MKPTIGITRCSKLDDYVASVENAGARARILDVSESPRAVLKEIDGLLLTGGGDVDPVLYGEERHATVEDAEPGRDEFELDLARRAMDADLPTLAICRGAQVLNVAAGGTLVQDIPSARLRSRVPHASSGEATPTRRGPGRQAVETTVTHSVQQPDHLAHQVSVTPGSHLERALGGAVDASRLCRVNSRHHQSVGRVGESLVASATAPDGVIEAIERPQATFCLGVQWHPENFWKSGEFRSLFETFVAAATRRHLRRGADGC